jgi:hypothetical protein
MEARELRLGNYVNNLGSITQIHELKINYCTTNIYTDVEYSKIEPIPLTEEWLQKLNFNKRIQVGNDFYEVSVFNETIEQAEESDEYMFSVNNEDIVILKSVSHLQNLFFFHTGQELTIK